MFFQPVQFVESEFEEYAVVKARDRIKEWYRIFQRRTSANRQCVIVPLKQLTQSHLQVHKLLSGRPSDAFDRLRLTPYAEIFCLFECRTAILTSSWKAID